MSMYSKHQKLPRWEDRVILSGPGEELMWREKTPEEKLLSNLPSHAHKGATFFSNAIKRKNNFND